MTEHTDRELLELAAKVYGAGQYPETGEWEIFFERIEGEDDDEFKEWNPLEDYGDALRLAAHCMMDIEIGITYVTAAAPLAVPPVSVTEVFTDGARRLPMTRRAIVRAAAAMAGGEA